MAIRAQRDQIFLHYLPPSGSETADDGLQGSSSIHRTGSAARRGVARVRAGLRSREFLA